MRWVTSSAAGLPSWQQAGCEVFVRCWPTANGRVRLAPGCCPVRVLAFASGRLTSSVPRPTDPDRLAKPWLFGVGNAKRVEAWCRVLQCRGCPANPAIDGFVNGAVQRSAALATGLRRSLETIDFAIGLARTAVYPPSAVGLGPRPKQLVGAFAMTGVAIERSV